MVDSLKTKFRESQGRKKEEQAFIKRMRLEAAQMEKIEFEKQFRVNAQEVAIARAKKDAAKLSGIQKLRAQNRVRNLQKGEIGKSSILARLREHTARNLANREDRLKKTEMLRGEAKKLHGERMQKRLTGRQDRWSKNPQR